MAINRNKLDAFVLGYLECAVWAEDMGGVENIHGGTLARMILDCEKFQRQNVSDLEAYCASIDRRTMGHAGHDFWLTRNRHGAGFWDRHGVPNDVGKRLTVAAHAFGPFSLYLGDDGRTHGQEG